MSKFFLLTFLGAVLVLSGASCNSVPILRTPSALSQPLTEDILVNNKFLIISDLYVIDDRKHRIKFLPGGVLQCRDCQSTEWRIKDARTIEFILGDRVMNTFVYSPKDDALVGTFDSAFDDKIKIWIER